MSSSAAGRRIRAVSSSSSGSRDGDLEIAAAKDGLRELLSSLEPLIKSSGSLVNIGGMLAYLEETDEGFRHYQLMEWMRRQLEASAGAMVAEEVALQCRETELTPHKMKLVAPDILNKVMQSDELKETVAKMRAVLANVSWEMSKNMDAEYAKISSLAPLGGYEFRPDGSMALGTTAASASIGFGNLGSTSSSRLPFERTDSGNDSLCSTWNNSNFAFLQPQQYVRLGERLNKFTPPDDKLEALGTLLSTQLGDVVSSVAWPTIGEGLQAAVLDQNTEVSSLGLKVYSRLLSNLSPFAAKEAYISLLGAVTAVYADKTRAHSLPTTTTGVFFKKKLHFNLVQAVKLISEITCDLPKYWTRFPEKYVDEIVRAFVGFLSFGSAGGEGHFNLLGVKNKPSQSPLLPIHLLSIVDNKGRWLRHWMHGNLGRSRLFRQLEALAVKSESGPVFPRNLARVVSSHLESKSVEEWALIRASFRSSARGKGNVSDALVGYGFFLHAVRIVCKMLQYERGRKLLGPGSRHCVDAMVHFVVVKDNVSTRGPTIAVAGCLATLSATCPLPLLAATEGPLSQLLQPIRTWCKTIEQEAGSLRPSQKQKPVTPVVLENVMCVICPLLDSAQVAKIITIENDDVLDLLANFVTLAFERHQSFDCHFLVKVLLLAEKLGKSREGPLSYKFPDMVHTLAEVSLELKDTAAVTPTAAGAGIEQRPRDEEQEENALLAVALKDTLVSFLLLPKSHLAVVEDEGYDDDEDVLRHVARDKLATLSEHESFSLLAFTAPGRRLLREQRFADRRLLAMLEMFALEGDNNKHWRPSPQEAEQRMLRATALFASLLSSLDFLREVTTANNSEYRTLRDLVLFEGSPFPNYSEFESVFALKIICCVLSGLDHLVYMEANFGIRKKLRRELECDSRRTVSGETIVDRESLYLHYICEATADLGGCGERTLPKLSFEEREHWDLRSETPPSSKIANQPAACTLTAFLNRTRDDVHDAQWLDKARKEFSRAISASGTVVKGALFVDLIDQIHSVARDGRPPVEDKIEDCSNRNMTEEEKLAISMILRYGRARLGLLPDSPSTDLARLVAKWSGKRNGGTEKETSGFDWFVGLIFMMCEGDAEATDGILDKLTDLRSLLSSSKSSLFHVGHLVDIVLAEEAGLVYSTMRGEGISPTVIASHWMRQCYLNVLPFDEICNFVAMVAIHGTEYTVFFAAALFKHLQERVVEAAYGQLDEGRYLIEVLMTAQVEGFTTGNNVDLMERLENEHGSAVTSGLHDALREE
jgi:hypothetical protein